MKILNYIFLIVFTFSLLGKNSFAQECSSGTFWDATLGRCLRSQEVQKVQMATRGCMSISDEAQRKACYVQNATEKLDESGKQGVSETYISDKFIGGDSKNKTGISIAAIGLVAAVYAIVVAKTKIKECQSSALWFMLGGSVAAAASEISSWLIYKNGLKKIEEKYQTLATESDSSSLDQKKIDAKNAQKKAFDYLAEKEDLTKKVANIKGAVYATAAAMFAAAAVISAVEVYKDIQSLGTTSNTSTCPGAMRAQREASDKSPTALTNLLVSATGFLRKKDKKEGSTEVMEGVKDNGTKDDTNTGSTAAQVGMVGKMLVSPYTRLVANGIFTGFATSLSVHAFKQAKLAKDRAAYLRTLSAEFEEGGGLTECTPQDRSYPEKASCYCYDENNQPRKDREASALCQKKWNRDYQVADAGSYDTYNPLSNGPYGCVDNQMNFDEKCKCRETKLRNGQNNCMKIQPATANMGNLGNANWMSDLKSMSDKLNSGDSSAASINGDSMLKKAAALIKMKDDFLKKNGNDQLKKKLDDIEKTFSKKYNDLNAGTLAQTNGVLPFNSNLASSSFKGLDGSLAEQLKERLDLSSGGEDLAGEEGMKNKAKGVGQFNFDIGDAQPGVVVQGSADVSDIMNKNYDIGDSDINKDSSRGLFEQLSLRYQVSGLRRLFGSEATAKDIEEKANQTPSNK